MKRKIRNRGLKNREKEVQKWKRGVRNRQKLRNKKWVRNKRGFKKKRAVKNREAIKNKKEGKIYERKIRNGKKNKNWRPRDLAQQN